VHLNVQLREPLVPAEPLPADTFANRQLLDKGRDDKPRYAAQLPVFEEEPERTLVVVGDIPVPGLFARAVRWAESHGWPVVAEPFGEHPRPGVLPHGPLVLADTAWVDAHAPDRVVAVGRLTLSRPVAALLRRADTSVEVVGAHHWIESRPNVDRIHPVSVLDQLGECPEPSAWAREWQRAGQQVAAALAREASPWPVGTSVARTVLESLPEGATLFLGSSNPVRDVDLAAGSRTAPLTVVANRGLAGIDGCVSTASGIALAGTAPTYALLGDLTFLHDAGGLLVGPLEREPDLTVVVVNDDGGGIFTLLEPGAPELATEFERVFGTPTGTDLSALCAAHGVHHVRAATKDALATALAQEPHGLTVVEVPVDRAAHRAEHARLRTVAAGATTRTDPE
jgi:2-succinyl-5-enolpyruvyl-6-hydroxy-3-cyclohexene-1-carboxylate synthase